MPLEVCKHCHKLRTNCDCDGQFEPLPVPGPPVATIRQKSSLPHLFDRLETWWNANPEMRWTECLCGDQYRFCWMLYELQPELGEEGCERMLAECQAGTSEDALRGVLEKVGA